MKRIIFFIILVWVSFPIFSSISKASLSQGEIADFYYLKTIETISKYIDDKHTTLWFLYEYNDFLNEKLSSEKDVDNIFIINELIRINKENILKQLNNITTNPENIKIFTNYFASKSTEYKKYTALITTKWDINALDENWDNMMAILLKNWTYEDIDFALSRWLKSTIINRTWNIAFYDFIKTGWKFYPKTYIDKILAWRFDEAGTIDIVKNVIKKWFNLNLVDLNRENIAFYAVDLWDPKIIDLIFNNKNTNLNIKNKDWLNPIFYAISVNKPISLIANLLKNQNFDINATDWSWSNLIQYVWWKDIALLQEVLKRNIEINNQNKLGETEIITMMKSEADTKSFLKKYDLFKWYKKLDLSIKDNNWNDALLTSVSLTWWLDLFKAIIPDYNNMETVNNSGSTLLHIATEKGNIDLIKELLKNSINTNSLDNEWNSALNIAAKNKSNDIADLLLENWANVDNVNNAWENLLYTAIKDDNDGLIDLAITNKANPNKVVWEDKTSIFLYAVKNNKTEIIDKILKDKNNIWLEINSSDKLWENALFYAIGNKNPELVKVLLENWIDPNKANKSWITAIIYAASKADYNSFAYLLKYWANYSAIDKTGKNALINACEQDEINIVKKLIDLWTDAKSRKKCLDSLKPDSKIGLELYKLLK